MSATTSTGQFAQISGTFQSSKSEALPTKSSDATATTTIDTSVTLNGNGNANGHASDVGNLPSPTTLVKKVQHQDLAVMLSQVPWMRFSIVAQPDLNELAHNEALHAFVHQVTTLTISTVATEIHKEITEAVSKVIQNIAGSVEKRLKTVQEGIMQEITAGNAQKSATASQNLGISSMQQLVKDICPCPPPSVAIPVSKPVGIPIKSVDVPTPCPPVQKPVVVIPAPVVSKPVILCPPSLCISSWIWTPEVVKTPCPVSPHARGFRKTITTPTPVNALTLDIAADNVYTVYVNGKLVGNGSTWNLPDRYKVSFDETTSVVIAVFAAQGDSNGPVGWIAAGKIWNTKSTDSAIEFGTDPSWLSLTGDNLPAQFVDPAFVDAAWQKAAVIGPYGIAPWRSLEGFKVGGNPGRTQGQRKVPDAPDAPAASFLSAK